MFGCLRRLGCLALLLLVGAIAYLTRETWYPRIAGERETVADSGSDWAAVTPAGATRARSAVESLGNRRGPVYATLRAEDLIALMLSGESGRGASFVDSAEARVSGEELMVRGIVDLSLIPASDKLGPLGDFMNRRERVTFGGTLDVIRPGLAQYRVTSARVGDFSLPAAVIPRIIARETQQRPAGVSDNGIPFAIPNHIADVRVARGRITLYKSVP